MSRTHKARLGATIVAGALIVGACGAGTSPSPTAGVGSVPPGGGTTIDVSLQEWAVVPAANAAPAGDVTFTVTNEGPADPHEFVIMKTDLGASGLPTDENGVVDEAGTGIELVVDEIEDIAVGSSQDLTANLAAGKYVLLCNIYDEAEQEAHFKMGMRFDFTVN